MSASEHTSSKRRSGYGLVESSGRDRARPEDVIARSLSIWLLKSDSVEAAAQALAVIDIALSSPIESAALSDRLAKRKARCEKATAS